VVFVRLTHLASGEEENGGEEDQGDWYADCETDDESEV